MKLLIAEDEAPIREGLKKVIPWGNYNIDQIYTAKDGKEALSLCLQYKPDILFTDIQMPHIDGISLAEQVREVLPRIHIIFFSSHTDKEYLKSAIKLKAVNFIEKPLILDEVLATLQEIQNNHNIVDSSSETSFRNALYMSATTGIDFSNVNTSAIPDSVGRSSYFTAFVVLFENFAISKDDEILPEIERMLKKYYRDVYVLTHLNIMYYYVCGDICYAGKEVSSFLHEVTSTLQIKRNIGNVYISVGKTYSCFADLYKSMQTAEELTIGLFFKGYHNNIFFTLPVQETDLKYSPESMINDFKLCLMHHSETQMKKLLHNFSVEVRSLPWSHENISIVKSTVFHLLVILNEQTNDESFPVPYQSLIEETNALQNTAFTTFDQLYSVLSSSVDLCFNLFDQQTLNASIREIQLYIDKNYSDTELCVDQIANAVYLTPNYISHLFKKEMNMTLANYINYVRLEKAKLLLKNSNCTLSDVALSVGYSDANYFMRIFKKATGLTPTDYRRFITDKMNQI